METYQRLAQHQHRRVRTNELIRTLTEITLVTFVSYALFTLLLSL